MTLEKLGDAAKPGPRSAPGTPRILVVDDEADTRRVLELFLSGRGYEVISARHGAEAMEIAQHTVPDLVISDLLMPVMDGYTLLSHWKRDERLRKVPFIVSTAACTDPRDATFAVELGADAYLVKPIEPEELITHVQTLLESKARPIARKPGKADVDVLQQHNRTVMRKLADKMRQLDLVNRALELELTEKRRVEAELRQSEMRFRQLAESIPEVFWLGTPDIQQVLYVSPAYEKIWGRTRESLYENGLSWLEALHPDDRAEVGRKAFGDERFQPRDAEYRILRPDGGMRWVRTRTFPVRNEDQVSGSTPYIVGVTEDVTELKEAEAARRKLEEQLLQSQKMDAIGTLAGGIAHDFNNILSVIAGNAELALREPEAPEGVRTSLDEIMKASKRAMRLVQQILTFSRGTAPDLSVRPLRPLVEETLPLLRATVPARVALETSFVDPVPSILADTTFVQQILVNLVANAWHAIENETGRIRILLDGTGTSPQRYARLRIEDNGSGMDEAVQRRIFEPFFTTKPAGRGTGLGLSVVHGIVSQMNGSISVRSRPGEGTTFEILFPEATSEAAESEDSAGGRAKGAGQHVLYLDDEEALVYLADRMLTAQGFRVSGFAKPEEALKAVREHPQDFDLVVTDYNMPRISGLQVATEIAQIRSTLPVMMTSGYITDELRAKAAAAGVQHLIEKPDTIDNLCDSVMEVLSPK